MIRGVHTMFYSSQAEALRAFIRDNRGFPCTVVGGGSLIYANVMLRKDPATFAADGLPLAPADLERHYDAVHAMQRAERYPWADRTPKTRALLDAARVAGLRAERPPLAGAQFARWDVSALASVTPSPRHPASRPAHSAIRIVFEMPSLN